MAEKKKKRPGILSLVLILVCLAIAGFCAYKLLEKQAEYKVGQDYYKSAWEKTLKQPKAEAEQEMTINWETWKDTDIVAWIVLDDRINYPVMQGKDNKQYLRHLPDGSYAVSGSVFLQAECDPYFRGPHSIIYGHHMFDGTMFDHLMDYKDEKMKGHKLYLYLPDGTKRTYKLFSVVNQLFDPDAYQYAFETGQDFIDFQNYMLKRSLYDCGGKANADSRLLSLSTCDGALHTSNRMELTFEPDGPDYIKQIQEPASWYQNPVQKYEEEQEKQRTADGDETGTY